MTIRGCSRNTVIEVQHGREMDHGIPKPTTEYVLATAKTGRARGSAEHGGSAATELVGLNGKAQDVAGPTRTIHLERKSFLRPNASLFLIRKISCPSAGRGMQGISTSEIPTDESEV